ncbi:MAG: DUF5004 domain-containing protein [Bacteroidota bacterium]|nr:DUF5004 domain-containing protein [Bacteroidota bacterium]MDP4204520.1 DUF5004 domain-containing protein [Bacteroidota bacterium]
MKRLFFIISALILFYSCTPDEIPPIGKPFDRKAQLVGTWNLTKFIQTDENAKSKDYPSFAVSKDLTTVFPNHPYTDFSLTLKSDGTFTTSVGKSYVDMLPSGTWALDDPKYPAAIVLTSGTTTQNVTLGSLANLTSGKVSLKILRKTVVKPTVKVSYEFQMVKK